MRITKPTIADSRPRPPADSSHQRCPACGKRVYPTRAAAKRARKALFPHDRMDAYRCPQPAPWEADRWHLGHPRAGDRDRNPRNRQDPA